MSWPTILCASVAAACLTLAGMHLFVWWKDRAARDQAQEPRRMAEPWSRSAEVAPDERDDTRHHQEHGDVGPPQGPGERLRKKPAGEPAVDSTTASETAGASAKPTGTAAHQRTITATIAEIDMKVPSVTFKGPNNWSYSSRVADKDALKQVKVGDRVDITWTEAITLSVTASK